MRNAWLLRGKGWLSYRTAARRGVCCGFPAADLSLWKSDFTHTGASSREKAVISRVAPPQCQRSLLWRSRDAHGCFSIRPQQTNVPHHLRMHKRFHRLQNNTALMVKCHLVLCKGRKDPGRPKAGRSGRRSREVGRSGGPGSGAGSTSQWLQDLRLTLTLLSFSLLAWRKANDAHLQDVYKH